MDGSVEPYPPGLVVLWMLECPGVGGDTVFCDLEMTYEKLSAPMQERLHGLKAEHSDVKSVVEHRAKGESMSSKQINLLDLLTRIEKC